MNSRRISLLRACALGLGLAVSMFYGVSAAHGQDCNGIRIESLSALHFGTLRVQRDKTGWALVEIGGGYRTSDGAAVSARSFPSPGRVRVSAPAERTVLLRLVMPTDVGNGTPVTHGRLRAATLGHGMQPLDREGEFWRLEMPKSRLGEESVEVELSVGGELGFERVNSPDEFAVRLRVECQEIR